MKESWDRLEAAVIKVLEMGGLGSHVSKFKKELQDKKAMNRFQYARDGDEIRGECVFYVLANCRHTY